MNWYDNQKDLFYDEQKKLETKYPNLYFKIEESKVHLKGELNFQAVYDD